MNGSRRALALLLLVFLFTQCDPSRRLADEPEVIHIVVPEEKEDVLPEEEEKEETEVTETPEEEDPDIISSRSWEIAVMLPFDLDEIPETDMDGEEETAEFPKSSAIALEFYQGLELAWEKLEKMGLRAGIHVYDTRSSEAEVRRILNRDELPEMDVIIGPVFNNNLRIAADFARKKKIPLFSPLSSSSSITSQNEYYYSANATSETHYRNLLTFIRQEAGVKELFVFHQGTAVERDILSQFRKMNDDFMKEGGDSLKIREYEMFLEQKSHDLKGMMDSLETSFVLIPSYDEVFVEYALNQLAQINHHYPSEVFGMPRWNSFSNINYDYLEWMRACITSSYYPDKDDEACLEFERKFRIAYGYPPSAYSMQAYDLMIFIGSRLLQGMGKGEISWKLSDFKGIQTNFTFTPVHDKEGRTEFLDNEFVHILRFEDYMYKKIK